MWVQLALPGDEWKGERKGGREKKVGREVGRKEEKEGNKTKVGGGFALIWALKCMYSHKVLFYFGQSKERNSYIWI